MDENILKILKNNFTIILSLFQKTWFLANENLYNC